VGKNNFSFRLINTKVEGNKYRYYIKN
jgi:hypothetical protein